jgi:hypothetical protein
LVPVILNGGNPTGYLDYLKGDELVFQYNGTAFVCQTPINQAVINTTQTFNVYAAPVAGTINFPNIIAGIDWLSKRRVAHPGYVTLLGAAGNGGSRFTEAGTLFLDHPDGARISILGATMIGTPPVNADWTVTSSSAPDRASDATINLTMLRTKFATEVYIPGGVNGVVISSTNITVDRLLLVGDLTSVGTGGNGIVAISTWSVGSVVMHNWGSQGYVGFLGSFQISAGSTFVASYCQTGGFNNLQGSQILYSGRMGAYGCNGPAITNAGQIFQNGAGGNIHCICNAGDAVQNVAGGYFGSGVNSIFSSNGGNGLNNTLGSANVAGSNFNSNALWGIITSFGGGINALGCTVNSNGSGPVSASYGATVALTGSAYTGSTSPPVNTNGNGNAYIVF